MDNSYIEIGYKIVDADGNLPKKSTAGDDPLTEYIAPVNYGLHALFKNVDLYFNDVLINLSGGFHHYKEYLKVLLSYNNDYKNSVLRPAGWAEDDYRYPNSVVNANKGFWTRLGSIAKTDSKNHKVVEYSAEGGNFIGPLGIDYNGTPIINGINIRLQYVLNDPKFFLFGSKRKIVNGAEIYPELDKEFRFVIHKFIIHGLVRELQPSIYENIEYRLKTQPLIAGFKRYNMLLHSIPIGMTDWQSDSLLPS